MKLSYPKSSRLLDRSEFLSFHGEEVQKFISKSFIAFIKESSSARGRLGLSIRRKIGRAVSRNRFKRLCREYFRTNPHIFLQKDLHIVGRQRLFFWDGKKARADWNQLKLDLEKFGRWLEHRRKKDEENDKEFNLPKHQSVSIRA